MAVFGVVLEVAVQISSDRTGGHNDVFRIAVVRVMPRRSCEAAAALVGREGEWGEGMLVDCDRRMRWVSERVGG